MSVIVERLASSIFAGYCEVHFNRVISLLPTFLQVSTANFMSSSLATPVEMIIGFPFEAVYSIRGMSVISKEAILYRGTFKDSRKSTPSKSKEIGRAHV